MRLHLNAINPEWNRLECREKRTVGLYDCHDDCIKMERRKSKSVWTVLIRKSRDAFDNKNTIAHNSSCISSVCSQQLINCWAICLRRFGCILQCSQCGCVAMWRCLKCMDQWILFQNFKNRYWSSLELLSRMSYFFSIRFIKNCHRKGEGFTVTMKNQCHSHCI